MNNKNKPILPMLPLDKIVPKNISSMKCSPDATFENGSCISLEILKDMAKAYNEYCVKNNIDKHIKMLKDITDEECKRYLLLQFKNKLKGDHKDWINQKFTELMKPESKTELKNNTFRPDGPQGKFEWLSTIDINKVLQQYEHKYEDFKFLGAFPLDFYDLEYTGIKKLNFNDFIKKGITRFGIVFNMDTSDKSGSHWTSMFIDFKKCQIYYSDSVGIKPPKQIVFFIDIIKKFMQDNKCKDIDYQYNHYQHQKKDTECGVYSINFIIRLLKGKSFTDITTKRLPDDKVNKCRNIYFANANK